MDNNHYYLRVALNAFNSGNLKEAENILSNKKITNLDCDFDILYLKAIVIASQNRHKEAVKYYRKALDLRPNQASLLSNLGSSLNLIDNHNEAIELFEKALKIDPTDHITWFNAGNTLCSIQAYEKSLIYYNKAVILFPNFYQALNNYGKALFELEKYSESLTYYNNAIKINKYYLASYINKSTALNKLKCYEEALECCEQALLLINKSNSEQELSAEILSNKGVTLHNLKKYNEAISFFNMAIDHNPLYSEVWSNKGVTLHEISQYKDAIIHYDKAIDIKHNNYEAWANKGISLIKIKNNTEAIICFNKALELKPNYYEAFANKGAALHELKQYDQAVEQYDQALKFKADYAFAYSCKACALNSLKQFDDAIICFNKALNLEPNNHEMLSNLGTALHERKLYDESISYYNKALEIKPDFAQALANKAAALLEQKKYNEAVILYEKTFKITDDLDWAFGDYIHAKMKICKWENLELQINNINSKLNLGKKVITPFPLLGLIDIPEVHTQAAKIYGDQKFPPNDSLGLITKNSNKSKIRIGYFSADFRNHPVSMLTVELFELHNKDKFEIFAFASGENDESLLRKRLIRSFNQFIDIDCMSDYDVAKLSRELQIDIAVDLGGYTADSRLGIFSYRAAPIQISYVGYLGTLNTNYIDYLIADKTLVPKHLSDFYTENIIYLPSYQCNDTKRYISEMKFSKIDFGMPENSFVFCCFNNNFKILPATFISWMRILKAVENSYLFLFSENEWVESNLRREAVNYGIDSERLIFGKALPVEDYLARYEICDLFLDTFPYNAGTTASDALWTGLPVVTMSGNSFHSRMAASILTALEIPELITFNSKEYESLAIELASNHIKLSSIRKKLVSNSRTTLLFDTEIFTQNLESAYEAVHERSQLDLNPVDFYKE